MLQVPQLPLYFLRALPGARRGTSLVSQKGLLKGISGALQGYAWGVNAVWGRGGVRAFMGQENFS